MALKNVCLLLLAVVTVTFAAFDSINKVINYYVHKIAETGIQDPDFELGIRICIQISAVFWIRIRIVCFWASRICIRMRELIVRIWRFFWPFSLAASLLKNHV
jgi:hypothetical protein